MTRRPPVARAAPSAADRKINLNASAPRSRKASFTPGPPLKPQRKLFVGLLVGFAVWVAVLLTMYFTTIHSQEESPHDEASMTNPQ